MPEPKLPAVLLHHCFNGLVPVQVGPVGDLKRVCLVLQHFVPPSRLRRVTAPITRLRPALPPAGVSEVGVLDKCVFHGRFLHTDKQWFSVALFITAAT